MNKEQALKMKEIMEDPIKWAQSFVTIFDGAKKEYTPWIGRWYQVEMLRDRSLMKVYRCGRRTGKTETMVIDGLHRANTKKHQRILYVTPYETQVNLIFKRINEVIDSSPLIKSKVMSRTKNPYYIKFNNGSEILGFTTGASTGSGAASVRGQRADWIFMDEVDYMGTADFEAVMAIAGERNDIGVTMSSTPTGARSKFWAACTDKSLGLK